MKKPKKRRKWMPMVGEEAFALVKIIYVFVKSSERAGNVMVELTDNIQHVSQLRRRRK